MLLGDGKAELLGEIVTKEEERAVAEVVQKKLKETQKYKITGGQGGTWCNSGAGEETCRAGRLTCPCQVKTCGLEQILAYPHWL